MIDENLNIGVNLDPKYERLLEEILNVQDIRWLQIFCLPGTTIEDLKKFQNTSHKKIVHAAHEVQFRFNYTEGLTRLNQRLILEAIAAAEYLGARYIIIHPGHFPKKLFDMKKQEGGELDGRVAEFTEFIKTKVNGRFKVLIENMAFGADRIDTVFNNIWCPFYDDFKEAGFGFCFDATSSAVTSECKFQGKLFPPIKFRSPYLNDPIIYLGENEIRFDLRTRDTLDRQIRMHIELLLGFLYLNPYVIHMQGIEYGDTRRYPQFPGKLNSDQMELIVPYCSLRKTPIIIEGQKNLDYIISFIKLIESKTVNTDVHN